MLDVLDAMRGASRAQAEDLVDAIGLRDTTALLHGMRRWYIGQTAADHVQKHRRVLIDLGAMELLPSDAEGSYRGIRMPEGWVDERDLEVGDHIRLPHDRSGGRSSWTLKRASADRFSGKQPGKVGLVVRLVDARGTTPFIAPPSRSAPWFNRLYAGVCGRSYRWSEQEYALGEGKRGPLVEIVRIKR